jgi:hypothetical protein
MAVFTGTVHTYFRGDSKREELSDMIYNVDPEETPFISNVGKESVNSTYYEWLTDSLASSVTNNAVIEGDEIAFTTTADRVRLGNYTQISRKQVIVSGTARAVNMAGVEDELAYQIAKQGKELRLDMEKRACGQFPAVAGGAATARETAGFEAFLTTNVNNSSTGASNPTLSGSTKGYPNAAPVDGTLRAFSETILKDVIQKSWTSGGKAAMAIVGPVNKARASGFTGIAQIRKEAAGERPATIMGAADVYVSDFGNITFVPSRQVRESAALFVDPNYASIVTLRPFELIELAKTGDAEKRALITEWGVKVNTEKAHGVARALTTT